MAFPGSGVSPRSLQDPPRLQGTMKEADMQVVLSLRDSSLIWQMASKAEARQNAKKEKVSIKEGFTLPQDIPLASTLLATETRLPADFVTSCSTLELAAFYKRMQLGEKLSINVLQPGERRRRSSIACSVLPKGMRNGRFMQIEEGVYIYPPEACLYNACQTLPFEQALLLSYEMCGTFTLDPAIEKGLGTRAPLMKLSHLCCLANSMQEARGVVRFKAVLPWVLEGSASPRESMPAICFVLPKRMGGYGLYRMHMNAEVALSPQAQKIYGRKTCRCDLYVPELKLAFEYDSDAEHSDKKARRKDSRRQTALALEGVETISLTSVQLASTAQMDGIAELLAARLGESLDCRVKDYMRKKCDLQEKLLGRKDWLIK